MLTGLKRPGSVEVKRPRECRAGDRVEPGFHQVGFPCWRLQASPNAGDAHRSQEEIPFVECWLKLSRRSRARQGLERISCRPISTLRPESQEDPGFSGPAGSSD